MDAKHWDDVAADYDDIVFDSLAADRRGHMTALLNRLGSKRKTVGDFGCGVGKYLPALAARFGRVIAMDHSAECIAVAQKSCRRFANIEYHTHNLGRPRDPLARVDVALCANVLLAPSLRQRRIMLENIRRSLKPRGRLLLLAPSFESALLTHHRRLEWKRRTTTRKVGRASVPAKRARLAATPSTPGWMPGSVRFANHSGTEIANGHLRLNRVLTKHHLREELEVELAATGFRVEDVRKLEYPWSTEFDAPPKWMKDPYPWDWLMQARV